MTHFYNQNSASEKILSTLKKIGIACSSVEEIIPNTELHALVFQELRKNNAEIYSYQSDTAEERSIEDDALLQDYLAGAAGEERVCGELMQLDGRYHLINGWRIMLPKAKFWAVGNRYVRGAIIDHMLIGPSGLSWLHPVPKINLASSKVQDILIKGIRTDQKDNPAFYI